MSVNVTWFSHACILIETKDARLLVDPFLSGNPAAAISAKEIREADVVAGRRKLVIGR